MGHTPRLAAFLALACLAACGGGGGSPGTSPFGTASAAAPAQPGAGSTSGGSTSGGTSGGGSMAAVGADAAEGFWTGTTSTGYVANVLVLETGEFWSLYGKNGLAYGATHGLGSGTADTFSGSGVDYFFPANTATPGTVTASVSPKASISGTVREGDVTATFSANYDARYESPAQLADLAGTWPFNAISPAGVQSGSLTAAANGSFTGNVSTCSFAGRAAPRATGKNVFDTSITFASTGCIFAGRTLRGVTVLIDVGGSRTLTSAAIVQGGAAGFVATGVR